MKLVKFAVFMADDCATLVKEQVKELGSNAEYSIREAILKRAGHEGLICERDGKIETTIKIKL